MRGFWEWPLPFGENWGQKKVQRLSDSFQAIFDVSHLFLVLAFLAGS